MQTFRCPKCKNGISDTIYIKIKKASCKNCRKKMIKLYKPTLKMIKLEDILNKQYQK